MDDYLRNASAYETTRVRFLTLSFHSIADNVPALPFAICQFATLAMAGNSLKMERHQASKSLAKNSHPVFGKRPYLQLPSFGEFKFFFIVC